MKTNIVFFGTGEFAAPVLEKILENTDFVVKLVITQPDRPSDRDKKIKKSPVKILAEEKGLEIFQPVSLKNIPYPLSDIDLNIVVEYGLIIPQNFLDAPKFQSINIHPSLLPKYRGASPIQSALLNGKTETGVTIMLMDAKMDHGPILAQEKVDIDPDDTFPILSQKLVKNAQILLLNTIPNWLNSSVTPKLQDDSQATFCKILTREDGKASFNKTNDEIYNQYRGLTPWPGLWTTWNAKRLKLEKITKSEKKIPVGVVQTENSKTYIGCSHGSIEILELQLEGKKTMDAKTFLNGYGDIGGARL